MSSVLIDGTMDDMKGICNQGTDNINGVTMFYM